MGLKELPLNHCPVPFSVGYMCSVVKNRVVRNRVGGLGVERGSSHWEEVGRTTLIHLRYLFTPIIPVILVIAPFGPFVCPAPILPVVDFVVLTRFIVLFPRVSVLL